MSLHEESAGMRGCFRCQPPAYVDEEVCMRCDKPEGQPCLPCEQLKVLEAEMEKTEARMNELLEEHRRMRTAINRAHDPIIGRVPQEITSLVDQQISTIPNPPLARKPLEATDEPDSFYETPPPISPRQRIRAQLILPAATANSEVRNKRTSAYDVYDDYLPAGSSSASSASDTKAMPKPNPSLNPFATPQDSAANRNSGVGAMLLNMDMDDSDLEDEDAGRKSGGGGGGNGSKHAALAAAVTTSANERAGQSHAPSSPSRSPQQHQRQRQQQQQQQRGPPPPPQPIAAPQPGYPAPLAALNLAESFSQPSQPPQMRQIPMPPPLRINPTLQNPFEPPMPSPFIRPESTSPHPLLPPVTPITPAFIRPAKKSGAPAPAAIKFDEASLHGGEGTRTPRPPKPIMRGDTEETLLPSRGEKGDDFWRRFSMVAKLEHSPASKSSAGGSRSASGSTATSWLSRTQSGKDRYARTVWAVGLTLLLIIIGAVGCGVYFTRNAPDHQQPKVFGGSADQAATYSTAATAVGGKVVTGAGGVSTVLHVSPTNVVDRRAEPTGVREGRRGVEVHLAKRRLENSAGW